MAYAINYKESFTSNDAMHIPALSETQGELEGSTVKCNGTEQWPSSSRLGLSKTALVYRAYTTNGCQVLISIFCAL